MRCFNKDEEWGFFVDLEIDYENITKKIIQPIKTTKSNSRKTINYMSAIYEEDYWYERDEFHHEYEGEYEIKKEPNKETNKETNKEPNKETNKDEKYDKQSTTIIIYCIFCASVISLSLIFI
jgi:hypothetical protein